MKTNNLLRTIVLAVHAMGNAGWPAESHRQAMASFTIRTAKRPNKRNRTAAIRARRDANKRAKRARIRNAWHRLGKR